MTGPRRSRRSTARRQWWWPALRRLWRNWQVVAQPRQSGPGGSLVDYASHTTQVEQIREELATALAGIAPGPARIPLFSTVQADWIEGTDLDAGYWYRNLRHTVQFEQATRRLLEQGHRVFVEVSPHPVLDPASRTPSTRTTARWW